MNPQLHALVTGANSGMGRATSLALARKGYRVIMLVRSEARGREALAAVGAAFAADPGEADFPASEAFSLVLCDLASLSSIRALGLELHGRLRSLDILVNNAGLISPKRQLSADGFELQFGVNHLGHFLLTSLLLDLVEAAKGRIVVVASGAHKVGRIHWEDLGLERGYSTFGAYAQSKLANVLFARELARRVKDKGVRVNACHPGAVATSMGIDRVTGFGSLIAGILKLFFLSPEQGADTAVWLATSPEAAGETGGYWHKRRPAAISRAAADDEAAKRLWELSERLTSAQG